MTYEAYDASSAQKRLYLIDRMRGDSILYNVPTAWLIEGRLDVLRLQGAVKKLIRRHETLRTSFASKDGEVLQKVHEHLPFQLTCRKIEAISTGDIDTIIDDFVRPFDLEQIPLWRMELVRLGPGKHLLVFDFHHIIADGAAMWVVVNDLMVFYNGEELPELEYQYVDFTMWQNEQLEGDKIKRQGEYWLKVFEGELPVLEMPMDFPRARVPGIGGHTIDFEMGRELTAGVHQLAVKYNTTLYAVLLALYTILLSRFTGQEDIVVGTPVAGRSHREFDPIIGMFVNTLAIRDIPAGDKVFTLFLEEVSKNVFAAFENQDYPYEMLVEKLFPLRHPDRNPLFDAMFASQNVLQSMGNANREQGDLKLIPYPVKEKIAKFEVTLITFEQGERIGFQLQYRTSLFRRDTMERFVRRFIQLTEAVTVNPTVKISGIEIILEEEKDLLLHTFNTTEREYPADKTVPQLFDRQVNRTPDHIAVVGLSCRLTHRTHRTYRTYKKLNEESDRLAHYLHGQGVAADDLVGLMVERSLEMIIGILGILKAGAAYVPLNPKAPPDRNRYLLAECRAGFLVSGVSEVSEVSGNSKVIDLGEIIGPIGPIGPIKPILPTHLCYVIFTSGSTGSPKGVPITHGNLSPLLHWGYRHLGLGSNDRFIQTPPYYFDWSVWEIVMALTTGAGLYMVSEELLLNPGACIAFMNQTDITVLHMTPSQYRYFLKAGVRPRTLKYLFIGAEKLDLDLVRWSFESVREDCRLFNMYGPTECTIIAAVLEINRQEVEKYKYLSSIPIGVPVGNTNLLVLDKYMNICPVNVPGELYITGDGKAGGYLNNLELTAEKFVISHLSLVNSKSLVISHQSLVNDNSTNDQCPMTNDLLYRTGDRVRWLPDGTVEFLGRIDQQVKIRGLRIEPGEIEARLLKHRLIKEAVVIDRQSESGEKYLCAYIVSKEAFDLSELHAYLSGGLPDYMIPSFFVEVETIPLTPNGKVARGALPVPGVRVGEAFAAPADEIERRMTETWAEVLGIKKEVIDVNANFFQLGGHSLTAAALAAKLHKTFDVEVPLKEIFLTPTIRGLAGCIKQTGKEQFLSIQPREKKEYYPLSPSQERLFTVHQLNKQDTTFNIPTVLVVEGDIDEERFETTFKKLMRRHESFRTCFLLRGREPVQRIHGEVDFHIRYVGDIDDFIKPFDLSQAPLLRAALIKQEERKHLLIVDMHHIIADGISAAIMVKDFMALYRGGDLPALRFQYRDYAVWRRGLKESQFMQKQGKYWLERFSGHLPVLEMPTDYPRPPVQQFEGCSAAFEIDESLTTALKTLAGRYNATLYMVLLTVCTVLLSKYSGQTDIIIGTPAAGRNHAHLDDLIGFFINVLPMRNYPGPQKTFDVFLKEVRDNALYAFDNGEYQFDDLVKTLHRERDTGRNPLYDVVFTLLDLGIPKIEIPGLKLSPYEREDTAAVTDLRIGAAEMENTIRLLFTYAAALFKRSTIERMSKRFIDIVRQVTANPQIPLKDINVADEIVTLKRSASRRQEEAFDF
jgi:amino acid adenylation domain-containing protein